MKYYRLFQDISARSALGFGPGGGRWNHKGTPMIYLANYSAIAINEILSIKGPIVVKSKWVLATFEISGSIDSILTKNLPKDCNARPAPKSTKDIGTIWAISMKTVSLKVPSARLNLSSYPDEHNLLVNPLHPDFQEYVSSIKLEAFDFQLNN